MTPWLLAAYLAAQSLDTGTTIYALQRTGPVRYEEQNRLLGRQPSTVKLLIVKVGVTTGTLYAVKRAHRKHPTATKIALSIAAGIAGAAAWHNVRTLRRQ